MSQKPTIGRIVGFVLPASHKRAGEVVPAMITRVFGGTIFHVQLTPFVDLANDAPPAPSECGSVPYDPYSDHLKPRTWHWLPRE